MQSTQCKVHSAKYCVWAQYLEHNIDLFSQWVGVDQGQLEGNCVGVEEGAGLQTQTESMILHSALQFAVMLFLRFSFPT